MTAAFMGPLRCFAAQLTVAAWLASSLAACATLPSVGVSTNAPTGRVELTDKFKDGSARLECRTSCAGAWGAKRHELRALYDAELWNDLAIGVLSVGFRSDQTYYYLGRAAEGLGYDSAAMTYYRLSMVATKTNDHKCDGWINNCDGLVFPDEALSRVVVLSQKKKNELQRQNVPMIQFNVPERSTERSEASSGGERTTSVSSSLGEQADPHAPKITNFPTNKKSSLLDISKEQRVTINKNGFACDDERFTWGLAIEENVLKAVRRLEEGKAIGRCTDLKSGELVFVRQPSDKYPGLIQIQPIDSQKQYWTATGFLEEYPHKSGLQESD